MAPVTALITSAAAIEFADGVHPIPATIAGSSERPPAAPNPDNRESGKPARAGGNP
ncbi:hypothetical protein ACWEV3_42830 [Saccharopolyspora sp. NPDC003752]